jgi:hypothetical protein
MKDPIVRAQHNREQAANLLAMAKNEPDPKSREGLIALADQYARLVAELLQQNPTKLS